MFDKIKQDPLKFIYTVILFVLAAVFTSFLSFSVLQSDDYYYSAFFKDGIGNFISLTAEHFKSTNGRALVHFFAQAVLSLPAVFRAVINSAVVFFTGYFAFKISRFKNLAMYMCVFYAFIMFFGSDVLKETFMWTSGFYNYIFPAFITFLAIYLCGKKHFAKYILCFFAGATTEQWGACAIVMITLFICTSLPERRKGIRDYLPVLFTVLGYVTIFLSPATQSRLFNHGSRELSASLMDIPALSKLFLSEKSCIVPLLIFIASTVITARLYKGNFRMLYSGLLPFALLLLLPFHKSHTVAFVVFLCYGVLCSAVFFKEKKFMPAIFTAGGLTAIIIMLPTNTFEARITLPGALLLLIVSLSILYETEFSKKTSLCAVVALVLVSSVAFSPSYKGFYGNHLVERANLSAIKSAKETKTLYYLIDYDKNYAMRQMFNDGWFYSSFISLYGLEDCTVYMDSKDARDLYLNQKKLKSKALIFDGEAYVPMRSFLNEAGGSITASNEIEMDFNGKRLTCLDGIFAYNSPQGYEKYLIADENKLADFYTLYIKLDVVKEAFDIQLNVDNS